MLPITEIDFFLRVCLIGAAETGKSQVYFRLTDTNYKYTADYKPTVAVEISAPIISINRKKVELQIWDITGGLEFLSIINSYYRRSNIYAFFISVGQLADPDSEAWKYIQNQYDEAKVCGADNAKMILIVTKADGENANLAVSTVHGKIPNKLKNVFDFIYVTSAQDDKLYSGNGCSTSDLHGSATRIFGPAITNILNLDNQEADAAKLESSSSVKLSTNDERIASPDKEEVITDGRKKSETSHDAQFFQNDSGMTEGSECGVTFFKPNPLAAASVSAVSASVGTVLLLASIVAIGTVAWPLVAIGFAIAGTLLLPCTLGYSGYAAYSAYENFKENNGGYSPVAGK